MVSPITLVFLIVAGFGLVGLGLTGGGAYYYYHLRKKRAALLLSSGTVTALNLGASPSGRMQLYFPVVEFTTSDGEAIQFESKFGSRPAAYKVGASVRVRYDPFYPDLAEVESWLTIWLIPAVMWVIGGTFVIIGCMALFIMVLVSIAGG